MEQTSEKCVIFLYIGNRHGHDGNCLLHRPLWRAFSYFHAFIAAFEKAVKGGVRILRGTRRLMRSPLCVKMDQWNKTRKLLAEPRCTPGWGDSRVGQWDRRWVGVNSESESVVVPPLSPPSPLPPPPRPLWYLLTEIDLGTFAHWWVLFFFFLFPLCSKERYQKLPHSHGLALIMWQKLSLPTAVSRLSYRAQTIYIYIHTHIHTGTGGALHGILMLSALELLFVHKNKIKF